MNELEGNEIKVTLASMIDRVENTKTKFIEGSSQYSLQRNRLKALKIALGLLSEDTTGLQDSLQDLVDAQAPLESLISKSEKARLKLVAGSWQHTMLSKNLEALHFVLPLLKKAIAEGS